MLFGERFDGFKKEDFAAFEPRKWSSNLFNRERMSARARLQALGQYLEGPLTSHRPFKWDVTPHNPSIFNGGRVNELVLYFTRTDAEQKDALPLLDSRIPLPEQLLEAGEHHRNVTLGVRLRLEGVQVGFMLHSTAWLDVMNLLNRCKVPFERFTFVDMVKSLPEGVRITIAPDRTIEAAGFEPNDLDELEGNILDHEFLVFVGRLFSPDDDAPASEGFKETCRSLLDAVEPLWEFAAWKPATDFLRLAGRERERKAAVRSGVANLEVGSKVRITQGPFQGRTGVVKELDGKGFVRVLVGKVMLRAGGRDLAVE